MQKKIYSGFIMCAIVLFSAVQSANAETIEVRSMSNFSTAAPPQTITVQLLEPLTLENLDFKTGTEITGKLTNVRSPKRMKRNAKFSFKPTSYKDLNGTSREINTNICAKYTTPLDKADIAKSAAKGAGNMLVKGFGIGYSAIEGAVKNEQDNRLKSSAVSIYESSPISYVEKGKDIEIKESDIFYLKFPDKNNENNKKGAI